MGSPGWLQQRGSHPAQAKVGMKPSHGNGMSFQPRFPNPPTKRRDFHPGGSLLRKGLVFPEGEDSALSESGGFRDCLMLSFGKAQLSWL